MNGCSFEGLSIHWCRLRTELIQCQIGSSSNSKLCNHLRLINYYFSLLKNYFRFLYLPFIFQCFNHTYFDLVNLSDYFNNWFTFNVATHPFDFRLDLLHYWLVWIYLVPLCLSSGFHLIIGNYEIILYLDFFIWLFLTYYLTAGMKSTIRGKL